MMEFREYATKEASASVRRAFTRSSEASKQQLDAVRSALDAAAKALASVGPGGPEDQDVADLAGRLTKAAASAAEQAAKQVADEAQKVAKQAADEAQKAAKQAADEAQKAADALRAELQAAVKQKMAVAAALKEAQTQAETLRAELKTATDRGEVASRQLGDARKTNEKHEAARAELTASCDELARARGTSENELHKARAALDAARADLALAAKKYEKIAADNTRLEDSIGVAHSQSEASEAKLSAVTDLFKQSAARVKVLEKAQQDQERVVRDLEARLKDRPAAAAVTVPAGASLVLLDDLLAGFQALGDATTITDVLRTLVEQLAAQFPRVALFRVKKTHLQGEHQIGFDLKTDIAKVVMPLGMDSLLARAASSGQIERLSANELKDSSRAPFSGTPGSALAVPIMVNGEALAIVYADDAGKAAGGGGAAEYDVNARFAEAMQQHASALVARLTNELKALAELQAYASSLLHELEQMHTADVQAGMAPEELPARLKGNLEYACSIYNSRIALEGADAAALLDDALAALLDAKQGTPFGRDLADAAGRPDLAARNAAEAS
jgi:predicted  nucleic acid-binding Zn-ribbon protein